MNEPSWIDEADRLLAASVGSGNGNDNDNDNDNEIDADIDRHIEIGLQMEGPTLFGTSGPSQLDAAALQRVIAALAARRAAITVELADLARRRVELARSQRAATGYASNGRIT